MKIMRIYIKYYNIDETSKNNIDKIINILETESDEDLLTLVIYK